VQQGQQAHLLSKKPGPSMSGKTFAFSTADISVSEAKSKLEFLKESFKKIHQGGASSLRFEELYRNAYLLVINKHGEMLYEAVQVWIKEKLVNVHKVVAQAQNENLLLVLIQVRHSYFLSLSF
jgi:cullin 3